MIREIAIIDVKQSDAEVFAETFRDIGRDLLADAEGCISVAMYHSVEDPARFVGVNEWTSKKSHLTFRGTNGYARYVAALGPFLASPPVVQHFTDIVDI
jgi:quinol monooxygenase YgiN